MTATASDPDGARRAAVPAQPQASALPPALSPALSRSRASMLIERLCVDVLRRIARRRMH